MSQYNVRVGLIRSAAIACALVFAWSSFVLADEPPASSPAVQGKKGAPPNSSEVQTRALPRRPLNSGYQSCLCYDGAGTCSGSSTATCKAGTKHPCTGTCRMPSSSSIGSGSIYRRGVEGEQPAAPAPSEQTAPSSGTTK